MGSPGPMFQAWGFYRPGQNKARPHKWDGPYSRIGHWAGKLSSTDQGMTWPPQKARLRQEEEAVKWGHGDASWALNRWPEWDKFGQGRVHGSQGWVTSELVVQFSYLFEKLQGVVETGWFLLWWQQSLKYSCPRLTPVGAGNQGTQLEGLGKAEGEQKRQRLKGMRFRAAFCEPSELFYLLWTLGNGPGTKPGTGFWNLTLGVIGLYDQVRGWCWGLHHTCYPITFGNWAATAFIDSVSPVLDGFHVVLLGNRTLILLVTVISFRGFRDG